MPTNFFANPATFGHRMALKPKMAIFGMCRPAVNMPSCTVGHPAAKCGWIGKKIGRHPQYTIIFDICSVFLKILIFVELTRD